MGGAQEGQLFGLKIEHLNLMKIVNQINSHSFYAVEKLVHYQMTQIVQLNLI